jgi:putative ABC transport system permease protein
MQNILLLAWRYLSYYRGRTAILVAAIAITVSLPLAARWVTAGFEKQAVERASQTPVLVGAKGSRFGLAIHGLYFRGESPEIIRQAEWFRILDFGLGDAIPLFVKFKAGGFPVVGTTNVYLSYRNLEFADGEKWTHLGDCVLGSKVAEALSLKPGDKLLSESENLFDLSGPSPLNMRITGILKPTGTADDEVIFCDLKTTWIMQGIGHGHSMKKTTNVPDSNNSGAADKVNNQTDDKNGELEADGDHAHAAGKENLSAYNEVTDENAASFHFHGKRSDFPLTAIIALPDSEKSETMLLGKYFAPDEKHQIIRPIEVVSELLDLVGKVRVLFDVGTLVLTAATVLLIAMVLSLSIRLRRGEIRTMVLIGCSRGTIFKVISCELVIVLVMGSLFGLAIATLASRYSDFVIRYFL